MLYGTASFTVKIAVIIFYHRIFPTNTTRLGCYILGGTCVAWYIVIVIVFFTACLPIESNWDPNVPGHCIDNVAFAIPPGVINVLIDAATVCLPIYEVSKLKMARQQKYITIFIFVIGGL